MQTNRDEMKRIDPNFDKISIFNSPVTSLRVLLICLIELLINTI